MGDQHARERLPAESGFDAPQMTCVANTSIDQCGHSSSQQIGIVAGWSGPGRSIIRREDEHGLLSEVVLHPNVDEIAIGKRSDQIWPGAGEPAD